MPPGERREKILFRPSGRLVVFCFMAQMYPAGEDPARNRKKRIAGLYVLYVPFCFCMIKIILLQLLTMLLNHTVNILTAYAEET